MGERLLGCFGAVVLLVLVALLTPVLMAFGGFITGWILQHVFPWAGEYVVRGLQLLHIEVQLSQLPMFTAILGFVGGFFKSSTSSSYKSKS